MRGAAPDGGCAPWLQRGRAFGGAEMLTGVEKTGGLIALQRGRAFGGAEIRRPLHPQERAQWRFNGAAPLGARRSRIALIRNA